VKTAAVGGGKVGDVITYTLCNQYREHYPYECNRNRPNGRFNDHWKPIATLAVGASNSTIKGTYTITQADIDAGKVVNTALATAKDPRKQQISLELP
jgi:hypothetical protein